MTDNGASVPDRAFAAAPSSPSVSPVPASIPSAVEQLARGLFLAEHPNAEWNGGRARSIWWARAYAALEAMREPTSAMLQGACDKHIPGRPMHDTTPPWPDERYRTEDECPRFIARRNIWQRMIDTALSWPTPADVASAIEARSGETAGLDPQGESATPKGDAQ